MSDILKPFRAWSETERCAYRYTAIGLAADDILAGEVIGGVNLATLVESYPDAARGPSVLVLQRDRYGEPLHILWGIPKGQEAVAVLITAYRPDPTRWSSDFKTRIKT